MSFRPQQAVLGYGWQTAVQAAKNKYIPADAIDRFSEREIEVSLTTAIGVADTSNQLGGSLGRKRGPRTVFDPQGTFTVPFALNEFNLGLLAQFAGAARNGAQIVADSAWTQVISPDETDVDLTNRWVTLWWDKTEQVGELWHPVGIGEVVMEFPKAGEITVAYTPVPLEFRHYGLPVTVAGTPTDHAVIRGLLNPTNNALADKDLWILVESYASPTATCKAAFGGTPAGANTFDVIAGLDAEGNPQWAEVITDGAGDTPIGTADSKFEVAFLDETDVTALDEVRFNNPGDAIVRIPPTQPIFTSAAACLTIDGTKVANLEGITVSMVNDLKRVDGGSCRAFPTGHKRSEDSTCVVEVERVWTTGRHDVDLHDDAEVAIQIDVRHDQLVDPGGAEGTQFNASLLFSVGKFSDGQAFKVLSAADDDVQSLSFDCEPGTSTPQWELTGATDFEDIFA